MDKRKNPFVIGKIYHVFNRGVAKCRICEGEGDSWRFLQGLALFNDKRNTSSILWHLERECGRLTMNVLKSYVVQNDGTRQKLVRILAYCVMGNHYHLLIEEIQEGGVTKFMHKLGTGYARYFNNKNVRVGPLFQGRFKSVLVNDERYLQYLLIYINVLNPAEFIEPNWKENGIQNVEKALKFAEQYPWSSHLDYLGKRGSLILDKGVLGEMFSTPGSYQDLTHAVLEGKKHQEISHLIIE